MNSELIVFFSYLIEIFSLKQQCVLFWSREDQLYISAKFNYLFRLFHKSVKVEIETKPTRLSCSHLSQVIYARQVMSAWSSCRSLHVWQRWLYPSKPVCEVVKLGIKDVEVGMYNNEKKQQQQTNKNNDICFHPLVQCIKCHPLTF